MFRVNPSKLFKTGVKVTCPGDGEEEVRCAPKAMDKSGRCLERADSVWGGKHPLTLPSSLVPIDTRIGSIPENSSLIPLDAKVQHHATRNPT